MMYKIRKDTYIRIYRNIGYITSVGLFNDRVVDASGAIFLAALSYDPQELDELVDKIMPYFTNPNRNQITSDAYEFYNLLD